jgi:hypothetical protein
MHSPLQRLASSLGALLLLGATAGCGDNILLYTSYSVRDSAGAGYGMGDGSGGGGRGYSDKAPAWPVRIPVAVHAAENSSEPTPILQIRRLTLTIPPGSACVVSSEPDCSLTCSFELRMDGPGPCSVRMEADTAERPVVQCFNYTLSPMETFDADSTRADDICPD